MMDGYDLDKRIEKEVRRLRIAVEISNRLAITRQAYELDLIDKTQYGEYIKELLEGDD
jgi:hypothetical protein